MKYFWIRIFDYKVSDDYADFFVPYKGTLLDEYYLSGETMSRDECKKIVISKSHVDRFAKPRKKDGIYAIVLDSNKYFYDQFTKKIDTFCFNPNCNCHIAGPEKNFPSINLKNYDDFIENNEYVYFCSYDCLYEVRSQLLDCEGEFQHRIGFSQDNCISAYIYHIYNRKTNMHYVGQTKYMPFFRWQEHARSKIKGDICDLVFETIAEISTNNKEYINSVEAWWIKTYQIKFGKKHVLNISNPQISVTDLKEKFNQMNNIENKEQMKLL